MYAQDSIDLLKNSGIDFHKFGTLVFFPHVERILSLLPFLCCVTCLFYSFVNCTLELINFLSPGAVDVVDDEEHDGIDVDEFGELLMTSGLVLNDDIKWISFHSGYDFGYLVKLLTCSKWQNASLSLSLSLLCLKFSYQPNSRIACRRERLF
jgi:hypothetical protein